jgi:hypothetical protein
MAGRSRSTYIIEQRQKPIRRERCHRNAKEEENSTGAARRLITVKSPAEVKPFAFRIKGLFRMTAEQPFFVATIKYFV